MTWLGFEVLGLAMLYVVGRVLKHWDRNRWHRWCTQTFRHKGLS